MSNIAFFFNSIANKPCSSSISSIIEYIQDFMVIYILTKFGANCSKFVGARV